MPRPRPGFPRVPARDWRATYRIVLVARYMRIIGDSSQTGSDVRNSPRTSRGGERSINRRGIRHSTHIRRSSDHSADESANACTAPPPSPVGKSQPQSLSSPPLLQSLSTRLSESAGHYHTKPPALPPVPSLHHTLTPCHFSRSRALLALAEYWIDVPRHTALYCDPANSSLAKADRPARDDFLQIPLHRACRSSRRTPPNFLTRSPTPPAALQCAEKCCTRPCHIDSLCRPSVIHTFGDINQCPFAQSFCFLFVL